MPKKIFIWDFHGTLETGTLHILTEIANILLKKHGGEKQYTLDEFINIPSFSWNTFFERNLSHLSQKEIYAVAQDAYNEKKFSYLFKKYSQPNSGAEKSLRAVKNAGGVNIVVSHSRQDKLGYYLEHVGLINLVHEYYGVDDGTVASRKDVLSKKTTIIREVLVRHSGAHVHAVGDAGVDFHAAQAANVDVFYWLLPSDEDTQPHLHADVPKDKLKFILNLEEIIPDL